MAFATVPAGGAAAQEVSFSSGTYRVYEGDVLTPELVLSHARSEDVTVRVEALHLAGGAESGEDFAADPWTVTVPAGKTRHSFGIATFDDDEPENNEEFLLHVAPWGHSPGLRRSSGGNPDAVAHINDNDTFVSVSLPRSTHILWEGDTATIRVTIPKPRSTAFTLDYTLSGGTASGADVVGGFGTRSVNVPANARGVDIRIRTAQDDVPDEGTETFSVRLSTSELGIVFGARTADVSISDDDTTPTVTFESAASSADESAGTHHVTVKLSPAPVNHRERLHITYGRRPHEDPRFRSLHPGDGSTATPGSDYVIPASIELYLAKVWGTWVQPGETTVTVPVTIVDDGAPEGDETVVLRYLPSSDEREVPRLRTPHGTHTLTIVDNDMAVSFATASQSVLEASGTHDVTVNLTAVPASDLTVGYTVGGTATPGADYAALSGTVTVPAGVKTATIPVALVDDGVDDAGETVVLTLAAGEGYEVGGRRTHTLHVDPVPTVTFDRFWKALSEDAGTYRALVHLSPPPASDITLHYTVGPDRTPLTGTPTPGQDYQPLPGTVTVPAGATKVHIPVTIIDDSVEDSGEAMELTLVNKPDYRVGSRYPSLIICIKNHETDDLETLVQARLDAAVADGDGASESLWRRALAAVRGEAPPDGLSPLTGAEAEALAIEHAGRGEVELASLWSEIARVIGDDATNPPPEPAVTIAAGASPVTEGGDAAFTLTADPAPAADLPVTVTVAADGDYGVAAGERTVTIPTTGSVTLTLATTGDGADEPDGSVTVTVTDGDGYTVGSSASGSVTVQDDDEPAVTIVAGTSPVTEGGDAAFTLTADPAPAADLAVSVTVAADGDYGIAAGERTVTIPTTGSATLTLPTTGDNADEPDGSVTVTVKDGEGYTVGSAASGSVTVQDDDEPVPEVTIAAGASPIMEGGDAVFTLTANPAPAADLAVSVTVAATGDWGVTAGTRTVTIPASGSVVLTLATTGDDADEPDGSVSMTVTAGSGYTVGSAASGSVTVRDDDGPTTPDYTDYQTVVNYLIEVRDNPKNTAVKGNPVHIAKWNRVLAAIGHDSPEQPMPASDIHAKAEQWPDSPFKAASVYLKSLDEEDTDGTPPDTPPVTPPEITVSADAASVTEGGDAAFTLTASPAPAADLAVSVTVATDGDWGIAAGTRTVTIPTSGSATLTLATTDDAADEADGSVTVTVADGDGWTAGDPASGTVAIRDDDVPAVAVSPGSAVTEGGNAVFTLTASPAPAADLPVSVTVATDGDYGIAAGTQTVTIPTTGSATLTLATTDDSADEPDGSATVTVQTGNGYTVGSPASGTVAVRDDDLPPPVVTIAAKAASVTEGGNAVFTLTADRAPDSDLAVTLAVSETGDGDHVAASDEGPATVTIPKDATEAAFALATVNDEADEPDGTTTVTVKTGAGYAVGDPASASVAVKDDDAPSTAPALSVGDSTAKEGGRLPVMPFTVRLSSPAPGPVRVYVSTRPSTPVSAEPGRDYAPGSSDLTFRAGETEKQVWILIYDDSHDEGPETFEVVLSDARGAAVGDGVAVGTIVNDDPMPAAWLARFGRTVAEQALDGIAGRMAAPRMPGLQGAVAGQAFTPSTGSGQAFDPAASGQPAAGGIPGSSSGAGGIGFSASSSHLQTMTARDALLGSSFSLTGEGDGSGGSMAFWGRASQGSFDGREGTFSLDGAATTALLGADYARGKWLIGLALAQSDGEGDYRDTKATPRPPAQICSDAAELCDGAVRAGDGKVEASLTAAVPYAALRVSERLKLWGAAGHGAGDVTLKTEMGGNYKVDTSWSMAAAGMRGDLLDAAGSLSGAGSGSGPALAVTSDALWTRTSSEKTDRLAASDSDTTRLRVGLEGSYRVALDGGGTLVPKLELGARHDGGDAETGFGVELGGGIAWTDPGMGLSLDLSGRTLLAHGDDDLKDRGFSAALAYDPAPATQRGASLSLRQDFGGRATGGLDALFQPAALEDRTASEATSRWSMEAAYGLPAFGGRFTGSPYMGLGLAASARDYTLGWRLAPEAASAPDLSFGLRATRRESDAQAPEHTVGVEIRATW